MRSSAFDRLPFQKRLIVGCPFGGAAQGPDAAGRRQAMADHGDIRRAISAASLQPAGSASWWRAVTVALTTSMDHLDREESGFLAGCLPRMTPDQRRMLGRQWMVLAAARTQIESGEPQAR